MPLGIYQAAASAHGEAGYRPAAFGSAAVELLFHFGDELSEEEVFVVPAGHVEVSVPGLVYLGAAGIGHHYDGRNHLPACYQFVGNGLHAALLYPGCVCVGESVQQVEDGIVVFGLVSIGQIYVILHRCAQRLAVDASGNYLPGVEGHCRQGQDQDCEVLFHIVLRRSSLPLV